MPWLSNRMLIALVALATLAYVFGAYANCALAPDCQVRSCHKVACMIWTSPAP